MHLHSRVDAIVDPPAIFQLVPDNVLAGTANAVIKASLSALQVRLSTLMPRLMVQVAWNNVYGLCLRWYAWF